MPLGVSQDRVAMTCGADEPDFIGRDCYGDGMLA